MRRGILKDLDAVFDAAKDMACSGPPEDIDAEQERLEKLRLEMKAALKAPAQTGGTKHDDGKRRWDLVPWDSVGLFVDVLTLGAKKYTDRNWEQGIRYGRLFAAAQRHSIAWWCGEDKDPETGISHLAHAVCNLLFIIAFVQRGRTDLDDR